MARATSDELQKLVQSLVETFDAHLEVVRRDVAAQQEAMVHEVRSLHEATIRAMAELRAAVHRVELALHDQLATLEPTPAAGIARPHLTGGATHTIPSATNPPGRDVAPTLTARPAARVEVPTDAPPTPALSTPAPTPVTAIAPTIAAPQEAAPHETAPATTPGIPTLAPRVASTEAAPPTSGLDVDRLVAMLESRLGEIDMASGTSPD